MITIYYLDIVVLFFSNQIGTLLLKYALCEGDVSIEKYSSHGYC